MLEYTKNNDRWVAEGNKMLQYIYIYNHTHNSKTKFFCCKTENNNNCMVYQESIFICQIYLPSSVSHCYLAECIQSVYTIFHFCTISRLINCAKMHYKGVIPPSDYNYSSFATSFLCVLIPFCKFYIQICAHISSIMASAAQ